MTGAREICEGGKMKGKLIGKLAQVKTNRFNNLNVIHYFGLK